MYHMICLVISAPASTPVFQIFSHVQVEYILIDTKVEYSINMSQGEMIHMYIEFGDGEFYDMTANQMDPLSAWIHNICHLFDKEGNWSTASLNSSHVLDHSSVSDNYTEVTHGFQVEKKFYGMKVAAWGKQIELKGNPKIFSVTSSEGTLGVTTVFFADGVFHIKHMTHRLMLFATVYDQVGKYVHSSVAYNHVSHNSTSTSSVFTVTPRQPPVILTSNSPVGVPNGKIQFILEVAPWTGTTQSRIQLDWNFNDGNTRNIINAKNLSLWLPYVESYIYNLTSVGDKIVSVLLTTVKETKTYETSVRIEQVITGANVEPHTTILKTGNFIVFNVTIVTGSHVTFNMSYDDGHFELKPHVKMFVNTDPSYFYHTYSLPGVYNPTVCIFNLISKDCKSVDNPIYIQNRIINLTLSNPPSLVSLDVNGTSGFIPFTVSIANVFSSFPKPTNVSIDWHFSSGENYKSNAISLSTSTFFSDGFTFHLSQVGRIMITLNCSNYINFLILSDSVHIYQQISGLNVSIHQHVVKVRDQVYFTATLHTGSEVSVYVDFGDGMSEQFSFPEMLAQTRGLTFSHIYSNIGNYTIIPVAQNVISRLVYNTLVRVVVRPDIHDLSLVLSSLFTGQLPGGVIQFSVKYTSYGIRTELFAKWIFGSNKFSQHFEYLSSLSSGMIEQKLVTFPNTYIGTHTASVVIDNAVSSNILHTNFTLEEQVNIKSFQPNTTVAKANDTVEFVALLTGGSHVGLNIDFGDGHQEIIAFNEITNVIKLINGVVIIRNGIRIQVDKNSTRGSTYGERLGAARQVWITHQYEYYGEYHMTLIIHNDVSSEVVRTSNPIMIQNPINNNIDIQCEKYVKNPPGILSCLYTKAKESHPSHVQCTVYQDDKYITNSVINDQVYSQQFTYNLFYFDVAISVISFNCSNLVSTMTYNINVAIIQTIQGMRLSLIKSTFSLEETIDVDIYVKYGSHINAYIDFKDGNVKHIFSNETNVLQKVFHVNHHYLQPGHFVISVKCTNVYSDSTKHIGVAILPVLHNITITGAKNAFIGSTSLFKLNFLIAKPLAIFNWTLHLEDEMIDSVMNTLDMEVNFKCEKYGIYVINVDMRNDVSFYTTDFTLHCVHDITEMIILATGKFKSFSMDSIVIAVNTQITFSVPKSVDYCTWYLNETNVGGNNYYAKVRFVANGFYELISKCKTPINSANDSINIFVQDTVYLTSVNILTAPKRGDNILFRVTFRYLGTPNCLEVNMGESRQSLYYGTLCDKQTLQMAVEDNKIYFNISYDTIGEYTMAITVKNYISESSINKTVIINKELCLPPHLTMTSGGSNTTKPLVFRTSDTIQLTSVIQDIELTCTLITNVTYNWKLMSKSLFVVPENTERNQPDLIIAANKLIVGNYVVTLTAEMEGAVGTLTKSTAYMAIVYPPLKVTLQGGIYRKVSWGSEVVIKGHVNNPVSPQGYAYQWSCNSVGFIDQSEGQQSTKYSQESSCVTGATSISSLTNGTLRMSTDHLRVGMIYRLSVNAKADDRVASASQLINVVNGSPPHLDIQ